MSVEAVGRRTGGGAWRWLTAPFSLRGLSGFALWGFFLLSVLATGLGFADLRAAGTETGELSGPELALTIATTLFVVSAMVVALHNMLEPHRVWWIRIAAFSFYLLFAVWTVGFGYGFFWKELAGQEFTRKQFVASTGDMAGAVERVAGAVSAAEIATREAADTASARAQQEAAEGRTCANRPGSTPGEGPLMRGRFAFADRARGLSAELRQSKLQEGHLKGYDIARGTSLSAQPPGAVAPEQGRAQAGLVRAGVSQAKLMARIVPPESHAPGGLSAPIRHDEEPTS